MTGHPDIHQDDVVISGLMGKEMRHALLSVDRHIHLQILVQQDIARDLNVDLIVLDQQRSFAGKIVVGACISPCPRSFSPEFLTRFKFTFTMNVEPLPFSLYASMCPPINSIMLQRNGKAKTGTAV